MPVSNQKRIYMWCHPRSLSTAFLLSMKNRDKCHVFCEPYIRAALAGTDRLYPERERFFTNPNINYSLVQESVEQDLKNIDVVFAKDMSFYIWPSRLDFFPRGYIHTFLIRKPEKTIPSMYKLMEETEGMLPFHWLEEDAGGFKSLVGIMNHVKDNLKQDIVVIDSDDLIKNPEAILRKFCEKVDIPFSEKMLSWEPSSPGEMKSFMFPDAPKELEEAIEIALGIGYKNALISTCYHPPKKSHSSTVAERKPDVDPKIEKLIEKSQPYYQILYEKRITI